ncbi:unnamed protein product [Moneuplotes crassus]|uniref:Peptidase M20 dimerisation domain-containing protein n=2 Tax=Euplotes crassus TaxID=5936 RepID=A0AAD1X9P9_EUPCR|nr:unnamed protein product [Moneuplotes crassus]
MDTEKSKKFIEDNFQSMFLDPISEFIKVPNLTPSFDPEFQTNGLIEQAIDNVKGYAESMDIPGLKFHVHNEEGRAPMALIEIPGNGKKNIMVYGHLDKQPHMEGWTEGTGPTTPTIIGDKLYGRGSTDDGYVSFATLTAVKNILDQGQEIPRIVLVLEAEEESGSKDLVYLLEKCKDIIKTPDVCLCCDSGALDYKTLWLTSSLRGSMGMNVKVSIAKDAFHSGICGGAMPETFRIANNLLDRLEDPITKRMEKFEVEIEDRFKEEAKNIVGLVGTDLYKDFKLLEGCRPIHHDNLEEMYLNINWRPALAVCGADGLPTLSKAGNVVRASTSLRLKIRLPPSLDAKEMCDEVVKTLSEDVPFGAKIEFDDVSSGSGWVMKDLKEETSKAIHESSEEFYEKKAGLYGIGGSIPFLKTLEGIYPETEILAMGVGGNDCNIHAPDETLDIPYMKKFIPTLSHILAKMA